MVEKLTDSDQSEKMFVRVFPYRIRGANSSSVSCEEKSERELLKYQSEFPALILALFLSATTGQFILADGDFWMRSR